MRMTVKLLTLLLATALLLCACGQETPAEPDVQIDYNDYVSPVVDRKVADCITREQIVAQLGYDVDVVSSFTDSSITYQSADSAHMLTLTLENMTRDAFDAIVTNPEVSWTALPELGATAYWNADHTELIAYENGYAFSMSVQWIADQAMISITSLVLQSLNG